MDLAGPASGSPHRYHGTFGSGFGHKFPPANDPYPQAAPMLSGARHGLMIVWLPDIPWKGKF